MVKVKPLEEAKRKLEEATRFIPRRYKDAMTRVDFAEVIRKSIEQEDLWFDKLTDAHEKGRRIKALEKVSPEFMKKRATEVGSKILGDKIKVSLDKWADGWRPYRETLLAVELPPKEIDPMANIDNRLKAVVAALIAKKEEIKG